jgi:hypothetical protein
VQNFKIKEVITLLSFGRGVLLKSSPLLLWACSILDLCLVSDNMHTCACIYAGKHTIRVYVVYLNSAYMV